MMRAKSRGTEVFGKVVRRWIQVTVVTVAFGLANFGLANSGHAAGIFLPAAPDAAAADTRSAVTKSAAPQRSMITDAWERRVRVAHHELAVVRDDVWRTGAGRLLLNVRSGVDLEVAVERTAPTKWGYSLSGRVTGERPGYMTLVVHEDVVAGHIWTTDATYELLPLSDGTHTLRDLTNEPAVECGGILQPEPNLESSEPATFSANDGSVVDILVVYTSAAEERVARWSGSAEAARRWIRAFNDMGIALANDAFERSGALVSLNLVGMERVAYEEESRGDARMLLQSDEVRALRDRFGADLVHATVACCFGAALGDGLSYLTAGSSSIFVAHEIGHNFGIGHERHEFVGSGGTRGYQHGFTTEGCDVTIMSYGAECYVRGRFPARPPIYASPWRYDLRWGRALGVTRFSKERGARGPADAVLTLNRNRHRVASHRPSRDGE